MLAVSLDILVLPETILGTGRGRLFTSKQPIYSIKRLSHYGAKGNAVIATDAVRADRPDITTDMPRRAVPARKNHRKQGDGRSPAHGETKRRSPARVEKGRGWKRPKANYG
jgi:hypothetical protein